jgi:tetratricopeptide (TPR) repeat protein
MRTAATPTAPRTTTTGPADYDQAIKLDPSRASAYNNRGFAYALKGEYDRAIPDYDQAIKLAPKLALAYLNRGLAFAAKGDHERAIADYGEAIKLNPRYAAAYSKRGELYATKGDYGRAIADYGAVIAFEPRDSDAWNSRCWARAVVDQLQAALADCNEALRLRPDDPHVRQPRFHLPQARSARRRHRRLRQALKLDAKLVESLYGRGVAKLRKGDIAGGNADMAAAKAIKPGIAEELARYGVR